MSEFDIELQAMARCRYMVRENQMAEIHYMGYDLHYHHSILHLDFITQELEAVTIRFCYRTFRRITDGPSRQYVFRKHTFHPPPRSILFYQHDEDWRQQPNPISINQLAEQYDFMTDEEQNQHGNRYHIDARRTTE
jgi:hypothetical protein